MSRKIHVQVPVGIAEVVFTHSNDINKRCLSCILKANEGKFHFLFIKQAEIQTQSKKKKTASTCISNLSEHKTFILR